MGVVLSCPCVDEEAGGDKETPRNHIRDAVFGFPCSVVSALENTVDAIVERGEELSAECEAYAHGDVVEACDAEGFVVVVCPEDGESGEDEVHEAVEVGSVDGEDLDDGLGAEEAEGADDATFEDFQEGAVGIIVFGVEVLVAGFFDEFGGFDVQELGRVGFAEIEEAGKLDKSVGDGGSVEGPSPGCLFSDEAAGDWPNGWTEERSKAV